MKQLIHKSDVISYNSLGLIVNCDEIYTSIEIRCRCSDNSMNYLNLRVCIEAKSKADIVKYQITLRKSTRPPNL